VQYLKTTVPFDEQEEIVVSHDSIQLLEYIRTIFDKTLEMKLEAEQDLAFKVENECNDYESSLQKLEAEVRQHIRVEQQLKLYVESVQSKLDDQEKDGETAKTVEALKGIENLQQRNVSLSEKLKASELQIRELKKRLNRKVEIVDKLEKQIENIPALKRMVKDMDKLLDGVRPSKSINESGIRASQRSSKESDSYPASNLSYMHDIKGRKSSQPVIGLHHNDLKSNEKDKNRESSDYIRVVDSSVHFGDHDSKNRSIRKSHKERDSHVLKSARNDGRSSDTEGSNKKMRKSAKTEMNKHHSKERYTEQGSHSDDLKEIKAILNAKLKEDMIEPSKFSCEGGYKLGMEDFLRKSFEKSDSKTKKKSEGSNKKSKSQAIDSLREKSDNMRIFSHKNSIAKASRPGTSVDKSHSDFAQNSIDNHLTDVYKVKEGSAKKSHDRSLSVDPKKKLLKKHKSRESIRDEDSIELHKKQASFSMTSKVTGPSKIGANVSGILSRGNH